MRSPAAAQMRLSSALRPTTMPISAAVSAARSDAESPTKTDRPAGWIFRDQLAGLERVCDLGLLLKQRAH